MCKITGHENYLISVLDADRAHRSLTGQPLWNTPGKLHFTKKMVHLDPDPAMPLLVDLYSDTNRRGFPADDMLRTFLALVGSKGTTEAGFSIDKWPKVLKSDSFYRALAGFHSPDEVPSVTALYEFSDRLWMGDRERYRRTALFDANKNAGANKTMTIGEDGKVIETNYTLSEEYRHFRNGCALSYNHERIHQQILSVMGVYPSMEYGCIPPITSCSMDSTAWFEHASPFGRTICGKSRINCEYRGDCGVAAHFSAPDASFGHDSGLNDTFYGEHIVIITVYNREAGVDIPVCAMLADANRHDGITFFTMMQEYQRNVPFFHMDFFVGDMAYDYDEIIEVLNSLGTIPIINMRSSSRKLDTDTKGICVDARGLVCCPGKIPMTLVNNNAETRTWEYRCPLQTGEAAECPNAQGCPLNHKDAPPLVVDPAKNGRICCVVPRDDENFRLILANRSSSERINNRLLKDYCLEQYRTRNADHRTLILNMAMLHLHADTWVKCGVEPKGELQRTLYKILQEDAEKMGVCQGNQEKIVLQKARDLKPVDGYVQDLRERNQKEQRQAEERRRVHDMEVKIRQEGRKGQCENWICPLEAAAQREEKQEEITAQNMPPASCDAPRIKGAWLEKYTKKHWENPPVKYEPKQVVIDPKGTIKPEPEGPRASRRPHFEGFELFPPPSSKKKAKKPEVVNGYEKAKSGAWVGPQPVIYNDPPPLTEEKKESKLSEFANQGFERYRPVQEFHTPATFQYPPLFGTDWSGICFSRPAGWNGSSSGTMCGNRSDDAVLGGDENATPGVVNPQREGGERASPGLKPDRSFCRLPVTKKWAMISRKELYFTKGLKYV